MVGFLRFILDVVEIASIHSSVTQSRHLLEDQPETFALLMNGVAISSMSAELAEVWNPFPYNGEPVQYFEGHPIVLMDALPDGMIIGGE